MREPSSDAPELFLPGQESELPDPLRAEYQVLSCLKASEHSSAFLLKKIASGKKYLLKLSPDPISMETFFNENEILEQIHRQNSPLADTFPVPVSLEQFQGTSYYIRSYIEGRTLQELCESGYQKPGIPPERALDYAIRVTELLHFLHSLTPPLIHRDIKPQNIVVSQDGKCHFIDLGISRFYDKSRDSDTVIMGTRLTAPPEQFGYQQTDIRSDLYSLGIVLLYCVTGEYEPTEKNLALLEAPIRRIVQKATMFDPDRRYQSTPKLLGDLLEARYGKLLEPGIRRNTPGAAPESGNRHAPQDTGEASGLSDSAPRTETNFRGPRRLKPSLLLTLLLAILCVCLAASTVYLALRGDVSPSADGDAGSSQTETTKNAGAQVDAPYTFQEPLIEEAVRQALDQPDGVITEKDLERVTSLHLMGMQIYSDDGEFWFNSDTPYCYADEMRESGLYLQLGSISSLEDITHMPNLASLSLYHQQITDLSPLAGRELRKLGIGLNPITDLTPLAGNPSIEYLNLTGLETRDAATVSTLTNLKSLVLTGTEFRTLKGLESCPLTELNLCSLLLEDYSELQSFPQLTSLTLNSFNREIAHSLSGMGITELVCFNVSNLSLEDLNELPALSSLYLNSVPDSEFSVGKVRLRNLTELSLLTYTLTDFSELAALPQLTTLHLYGADCQGYAGLDQIPKLKYLNVTEGQRREIQETYPDSTYIYAF